VTAKSQVIYLDYAASTPVDPAVARAMSDSLEEFGNPASVTHLFGRQAAARIETARLQIAALIGAEPDEIVLTSGATESTNLAILGVARANADRGRHLVTSRIEHKAVLDPCKHLEKEGFSITYLAPDRTGRVDPEAVRAAIRQDTLLVSVMHVNNEIGVVQDVAAIGALCRERGVLFHTDASQSAGKLPLDLRTLPVDLLSFTAHKLNGPKGVGALYVRRGAKPSMQPVSFGGGHERGLRPGTLATHQIVGFGMACELAARQQAAEQERLAILRDRLWQGLAPLGKVHLNGAGAPRVAGTLNVSFEGVEGESLVTGLSRLAVSTGSACNSASGDGSYVLRALGRETQLAQSSLRFSLGRFTTEADIDFAIDAVRREIKRLRAVSPAASGGEFPGITADLSQTGAEPVDFGAVESLSLLAQEYFRTLSGAGTLPASAGKVLIGEAGAAGEEAWVRFSLLVEGDIVKDARFEAYGCPHTLAVASWITGQLAGRTREALAPGAPASWAHALAVPVEKLGRLLVVEDALQTCLRRWP
jgi:cysteine desulfurase